MNGKCLVGYQGSISRKCIQSGSNGNWSPISGSCDGMLDFFLLFLFFFCQQFNLKNDWNILVGADILFCFIFFFFKKKFIDLNECIRADSCDQSYKAENDGWTSFRVACYCGHVEIVELLLNDQRVDINKAEEVGGTPFYVACEKGHIEIVKLLLNDKRIDFNKADYHGWTPFHSACLKGHIDIVKLLLNVKRVDNNKTTNDHDIFLHLFIYWHFVSPLKSKKSYGLNFLHFTINFLFYCCRFFPLFPPIRMLNILLFFALFFISF